MRGAFGSKSSRSAPAFAIGGGQACAGVAQVSDNVEGPGPPPATPAIRVGCQGALALPSERVNRAGHAGLRAGRRSFRRGRPTAQHRPNDPGDVIACQVPMIPPSCRRFHRISPHGRDVRHGLSRYSQPFADALNTGEQALGWNTTCRSLPPPGRQQRALPPRPAAVHLVGSRPVRRSMWSARSARSCKRPEALIPARLVAVFPRR